MSSPFERGIDRFIRKNRRRRQRIFNRAAALMHKSIVNGLTLTGSPGQPVDKGILRTSWQRLRPESLLAESVTNVGYAPFMEDFEGTFRSKVGGKHSVKKTRAGMDKIIDEAARTS